MDDGNVIILKAEASDKYWPSPRAHHRCTLHGNKLIVIGGSFVNKDFVSSYYNDIAVFDFITNEWIEVEIKGKPPPGAHRFSLAVVDDSIWYLGGGTSEFAYDNVFELLIESAFSSSNLMASGLGLANAEAGETTSFPIHAKLADIFATEVNDSYPWQDSWVTFQGAIPSARGLAYDISVRIIETSTAESQLAEVFEVGGGEYEVTYNIKTGRNFNIFIRYDNEDIPGSPFQMLLNPGDMVPSETRLVPPADKNLDNEPDSLLMGEKPHY